MVNKFKESLKFLKTLNLWKELLITLWSHQNVKVAFLFIKVTFTTSKECLFIIFIGHFWNLNKMGTRKFGQLNNIKPFLEEMKKEPKLQIHLNLWNLWK